MKKEGEPQQRVITIGDKKIIDERQPDPGFTDGAIFSCPVDVLVVDGTTVGLIDWTDRRIKNKAEYDEQLTKLVKDNPGEDLIIETVTVNEANELRFACKPVNIDFNIK